MEKLLLDLHHRLNPLHIYCRLIDRGIGRRISIRISRYYEIIIYKWLTPLTIVSISLCRLIRKN